MTGKKYDKGRNDARRRTTKAAEENQHERDEEFSKIRPPAKNKKWVREWASP